VSNVALIDPQEDVPTRIGIRVDIDSEGRRRPVRVAKVSEADFKE
jgi:ribosomal protein L24